ncbi:F0F1 ATP synthase subunit delta [Alkalihalobacillus trypoxylicola]|uniref:ATP synthase subunit delta n=1 Tax=Alkalihalobacillus trypoxylicola TaxID=519424 RepID=A0A161PIZ2_9BACI|nr:F0F1 ATP synthase subunit delta [Alkalihalobacillus trypoxylicola]KYG29221.1 ATP synthase F0F1 subunit delta [Alkalihalobacillus trypoxylicola]GAF65059.1 F0F1 ATP synthase subunit delta [Bacillus sp. TS-2]
MSSSTVANRYAQALFQVSLKKGTLEQSIEELRAIKTVLKTTPEFSQFLSNPKISKEQKHSFIRTSFQSASQDVITTLLLLVDKKRLDILESMIEKFVSLSFEAQNIAEATVYSAKALTEQEQEQIAQVFASKVGKARLLINNVVNADLLGGFKIRIGDRIYDGSIKSQLDRLERQLVTGTR